MLTLSGVTLSFKLIQHTPLIHFQHLQEGPLLRATEFKSQYDKYLICNTKEKFSKNELTEKDNKKWLNYKVFVVPEGIPVISDIEMNKVSKLDPNEFEYDFNNKPRKVPFPAYFGNLGDNKSEGEEKKFVWNNARVNIISSSKTLREKLEVHIDDFLAQHNFGTRGSKGFGSFYREGKSISKNIKSYKFTLDTNSIVLPRYIRFPKDTSLEFILYFKLFYGINLWYNCLRSGLNTGAIYFKSLMFMYAKSKNIQWDKKTIRDEFQMYTKGYNEVVSARKDSNGPVLWGSKVKRLMRDMLGLSTSQEWKSYGTRIIVSGKGIEEKTIEGKLIKSPAIERYRSPITIKPLRITSTPPIFEIYVIPDSDKKLSGKTFEITSSKGGKKPYNINTPYPQEFDLIEYLNFCFNDAFAPGDFDSHVSNSQSEDAKLLKKIFKNLKGQKL